MSFLSLYKACDAVFLIGGTTSFGQEMTGWLVRSIPVFMHS
jgi:hypothetical protein